MTPGVLGMPCERAFYMDTQIYGTYGICATCIAHVVHTAQLTHWVRMLQGGAL